MIKLCYKHYDYKFTPDTIRLYEKRTGGCLWQIMNKYLEVYGLSVAAGDSLLVKVNKFAQIGTFIEMSEAFYCLIKQGQNNIPLEEIQDAMFRTGILPTDEDGDEREPWTVVFANLVLEVNKTAFPSPKKADTLAQ